MVHQSATGRGLDGGEGIQSLNGGNARERSARPIPGGSALLLLSEKQAAALYGVSDRKFHDLRVAGLVGDPIVLGPRLLRWPRAEIEAAIARMPRQKLASAEPLQLAKARAARSGRTQVTG